MKIPSAQRFQLAAINDLCVDISNAGEHSASYRYSGSSQHIDVITRRLRPTGASDDVQHHWARIGSPAMGEQLAAAINHLEKLANSQEGQPS